MRKSTWHSQGGHWALDVIRLLGPLALRLGLDLAWVKGVDM